VARPFLNLLLTSKVVKTVVQRVSRAAVTVDDTVVGRIGHGLLILLGISSEDREVDAETLGSKLADLRIFPDESGLMNRSVIEAGGEALVVSQFTLYGETRRGRRPSFGGAARPEAAAPLIDVVCEVMRSRGITVYQGSFGARMQVDLVNDGPVTLVIETRDGRVV
jgi:D-tyrosyl-tRNA(Tyr) deacylase